MTPPSRSSSTSSTGLGSILHKAEAYVQAKKIDPEALLEGAPLPDMFTFTRQVQLACDFGKGAGARLAGITASIHSR